MAGEPPLVSIVTPAYNHAPYLAQAIDSVLAQDYPAVEYLVIDDGSTDGTREVLERYTGRLRWESQPNMGQVRTLNRGWKMTSGAVLGYLSADDLLFPGAVRAVVDALMRDPEVVMAYPDFKLIDPYSRVIRSSAAGAPSYRALAVDHVCMIGPGALFRRSAYQRAGGWNPELRFLPDFEFWLRLGLVGPFAMVPEALAGFRLHPRSVTYFKTDPQTAAEYLKVVEEYFRRPDVPEAIRREEHRSYSAAHLAAARVHLRGGRPAACLDHVRRAHALDASISLPHTALMLLRTLASRSAHRAAWSLRHLARRAGLHL